MYLLTAPCWVVKAHLDDFLFNLPSCFRRLLVRSSALVTKLKTLCGPIEPLVAGLSTDSILPAQGADGLPSFHYLCYKLFPCLHNSLCLP